MSVQEQDRTIELLPDSLEEFKLSDDEIIMVRGGGPFEGIFNNCWLGCKPDSKEEQQLTNSKI